VWIEDRTTSQTVVVKLRLISALGVLISLSFLLSACSNSSKKGSASTAPAAPQTSALVALGDSVPHGTNCECRPYPELSADGLATSSGMPVTATNDSIAGATTSSMLDQLKTDNDVIGHLRKADIVEIEIGANDVAYSAACGTAVDCYTPRIPTIEKHLDEIVKLAHELTSGHKVLIVLLDYWSVWLGGQYAAAHGEAYVDAAAEVTDRVNAAIKSTAAATDSAYVDLRAAFKGPNYGYDETHYLSSDGDHPNAAGHQKIAAAAEAVIERALHI
jgi:acyl-CoA thioesterase I